jgi:lipoprotein-anchoring transpeptidase ErfK/SrfK
MMLVYNIGFWLSWLFNALSHTMQKYKTIILAAILSASMLLTGCNISNIIEKTTESIPVLNKKEAFLSKEKSYYKFINRGSYPKTFAAYVNQELLDEATGDNTKILANVNQMRLKLFVNGRIALDSPTTTGKEGKPTPIGTFHIIEKIEKGKRSNLYGKLLLDGKMVHGGGKHEYDGEWDTFEGAKMDYWMRLTGDGVGIHHSDFIYRFADTHGCIRLPSLTADKVFHAVRTGTKVTVVQE